MKRIILIALFFVAGCKECHSVTNQELRQKLFKECLALLPKPPSQTHYSDWDEVVSECGTQAYYQSQTTVCTEGSIW
jgi:hypothetical protein